MFIMESMGKKKPRSRRSFTPEFKAEIVDLCQRGDRSVGQVAKDFDLTETAVREWLKQAERDAGTRTDGLTTSEKEELAQLRHTLFSWDGLQATYVRSVASFVAGDDLAL